jgi:hypothetical protein
MLRTLLDRARPYAADALLILVILLMALKLTHGLAAVRDVHLEDESIYLASGYHLLRDGLPRAEANPLYAVWYFALSCVQPDRIGLYFLNWSVLAFLLPASCYVLLRQLGGTRVAGLAAAFVLLTSDLIEVWPYPAHLAATVLALGTSVAVGMRWLPWALAVLGVSLGLAAYIRPEYAASFVLYCVAGAALAGWTLLTHPASRRAVFGSAALVGLTVAGLLLIFGNPLAGGRSFIAFGQHYAHNVVAAQQLDVNPWTNYVALVQKDFGDAQSFPQALRRNPGAILWHVSRNAAAAPRLVAGKLVPVLNLSRKLWYLPGALALGAALAGALGLGRRVLRQRQERDGDRDLLVGLAMLGLVGAPSVLAALLVYPRPAYLMPAIVLTAALVGSSLAWFPGAGVLRGKLDSRPAILLAAVVFLILTPTRTLGWGVRALFPWNRPWPAPLAVRRATVTALRDLHPQPPAAVLESAYSRAFYAGIECRVIESWTKAESFRRLLATNQVGVIVLDRDLVGDPRYRNDPEFRDFLERPEADGFTLLPVPGTDVRLAVRSDLLSP